MALDEILRLSEAEHNIEFKSARNNFKYAGGSDSNPKDRRRCVLGYVSAFCNEGGGMLVLGISDRPHKIVGSSFYENEEGSLVDKVYKDTGIRIKTEVFHEQDKRVLIIHIPGRPIGKPIKFEGIALMRTGDSLREMSDLELHKILAEQEPDFSATICEGLSINDLDEAAIYILREKYAFKQKNNSFLSLSTKQILSDLDLLKKEKLTYAALILLGKREAIKTYIPQSSINMEYRMDSNSIHYDDRLILEGSFFKNIDLLWDHINLRNGKVPIQQGPYIFDIPFLNEEVVREAIHNAIVHRDYRIQSEVVIKQSNDCLQIVNPGGFPLGVSISNILTVSSTPRNRLLADILLKTGIVERSGQGVDKLYKNTIQEAKGTPDYSNSDDFQVVLKIPTIVKDTAFVLFLKHIQKEQRINLSLMEILTLEKVREKVVKTLLDRTTVDLLLKKGLIERIGRTNTSGYILSKEYYKFTNQPAAYTKDKGPDEASVWLQVVNHLSQFSSASMKDFETLFKNILNREQVKYFIYSFLEKGLLAKKGKGRGTLYLINNQLKQDAQIFNRIMELGVQEMRKLGELPSK